MMLSFWCVCVLCVCVRYLTQQKNVSEMCLNVIFLIVQILKMIADICEYIMKIFHYYINRSISKIMDRSSDGQYHGSLVAQSSFL